MKRLYDFVIFWIIGPVITAIVITSLIQLVDKLRSLNFQ